jgi:hypothetical protein
MTGRCVWLVAALGLIGAAPPGPPPASTDPARVLRVPSAAMPAYLEPVTDPDFGSRITRITGDRGRPTTPVPGQWGGDARHVYSKQQPWSSDQSLLVVENRDGGWPTPLILDGATYAPRYGRCPSDDLYDYRWHPDPRHPHELINVDRAGTGLSWIDVTTCTRTRAWTLPLKADYGIGSGEGNPSNDGRFVAIGNATAMVVVDMDPRPPFAPYPHARVGPVYAFPPCSLTAGNPKDCRIGNLSISPSGRYIDVKYGAGGDTTVEMHRVFEVDSATLAIRPHLMAAAALRCGSFQARANGWIFPLKHADMALDPFDGDEDVIVGGRACPGSRIGRIVKVRLRDGQVTALTDPRNEAPVSHVSTRALRNPGWAVVSYYKVDSARFSDEVVAVKLDGSGAVVRLAHVHTSAAGCYRCEAHPVPSPDGRRVLFASNWARDCGSGCGRGGDIHDFVVAPAADSLLSDAGRGRPRRP